MPAIVMLGDISSGYTPIGPFASFEDASDWCDKNGGIAGPHATSSWIMEIIHPKEQALSNLCQRLRYQVQDSELQKTLVKELLSSFTEEGVRQWFDRPRTWLRGQTPSEVLSKTPVDEALKRRIIAHVEQKMD